MIRQLAHDFDSFRFLFQSKNEQFIKRFEQVEEQLLLRLDLPQLKTYLKDKIIQKEDIYIFQNESERLSKLFVEGTHLSDLKRARQ
jgi:hypothetical protein